MDEAMSTGDIIIGILAGLGVLVLLVVFVIVVKSIFFTKEKE